MIKWIVTDLDGTLLSHNKETGVFADPNTVTVVNRLLKTNNYKFSIATGRHYLNVLSIIDDLDLKIQNDNFVIGMNGAQIYSLKEKKLIHKVTFAKQEILQFEKLIEYLDKTHGEYYFIMGYEDRDIPIFYYDNDSKIFTETMRELEIYEDADNVIKKKIIRSFNEVDNVFKIIVNYKCKFDYEQELKAFKKMMPNMNFAKSSDWFIEIFPKSVDKANALKIIQKEHYKNIKCSEMLVFGDSFNDWGMLSLVENAVTRESADPKIKELCKYVIDSPASTFVGDALELLIGK